MKFLKIGCVVFGLALFAGNAASAEQRPVTLMSGLGDWHHPVSTKNKEAQGFFDQGLRLIYAFNRCLDSSGLCGTRGATPTPGLWRNSFTNRGRVTRS
jgi:hypothetical protein